MPLDVVTLNADGESLVLGDLMEVTAELVALIESDLAPQIPSDAEYGRDLHIIAEVSSNETSVSPRKLSIAIK